MLGHRLPRRQERNEGVDSADIYVRAALRTAFGFSICATTRWLPAEIELVTGIVGAAGGLGGFFLPSLLGLLKDLSGSYTAGLLLFAMVVTGAAAILLEFGVKWSRAWPTNALQRTGVFAYRGKQMSRTQSGVVDAAD